MEAWLERFADTAFRRSSDTSHDLKTPLNIAVLNLELLRMRLKKLLESEDPKVENYAKALEIELRRLARIFDAYFLLSTPPKSEGDPVPFDLAPICTEVASEGGYSIRFEKAAIGIAHETRIREAFKMFFEGASRVLKEEGRQAGVSLNSTLAVTVSGRPAADEFEPTKILKFYYTDPLGNPDLSLAAARLIAETYGGALDVEEESDKVSLRLSFPLGDQ